MRFDLHVHSVHSKDSITPVEKLCDAYAKLGFAGFALTDHGSFAGVARAQAHAREKKLPIEVVGGCEFLSDMGEVIGLHLNEAIAARASMPPSGVGPVYEFAPLCDAIHDQGGTAVLPHPFDAVRRHACRPDLLAPDQLR
ncbi:MAG: PHP domain-containing protein, partial [Candidatus Micrarchaeota archaeon]|nr:PHP domain-containing protein [Candidatus Micrarchaeota archaeon]